MMKTLLFYFLSLLTLVSAYFVVTVQSLFRGAMALIAVLLGIAGMYLLVDAQFLSAVQITVYIGGIVVLIVYVVLLISDVTQKEAVHGSGWRKAAAGTLAALLLALLLAAFWSADFKPATDLAARAAPVAEIGKALVSPAQGGFVLAFELISLVLIAAIIGAITVARARDDEK